MPSVALSGSVVGSPSTHQRISSSVSKRRYARIALVTTFAAAVANAVVYFLAGLFVRYHSDFVILQGISATVIGTAVLAVVAALRYAGLLRFTANPVRNIRMIAPIGFVVTTVLDFTHSPGVEGASSTQAAVLVIMHVVAATVITRMLSTHVRPAQS